MISTDTQKAHCPLESQPLTKNAPCASRKTVIMSTSTHFIIYCQEVVNNWQLNIQDYWGKWSLRKGKKSHDVLTHFYCWHEIVNKYCFLHMNYHCNIKLINKLKVSAFRIQTDQYAGWISNSYCSLKPLWSGMGEVVPARTSPTLHPPSLCCNYLV